MSELHTKEWYEEYANIVLVNMQFIKKIKLMN